MAATAGLAAPTLRGALADDKARIGLVQSTHRRLSRPASPEDPLDYDRVRDMVWKAIEYGRPRAGSLEAKIALARGSSSNPISLFSARSLPTAPAT